MSFLVHATKARVAARAYCGMWIADCLICQSALQVDRFAPMFDCWDCGSRSEIIWPAEDMVFSIERLLLMRPLVYTQNWMPGETLHDLVRENGEHGVFDATKALAEHNPGLALLTVSDTTIRSDALPVTRRRELKQVGA